MLLYLLILINDKAAGIAIILRWLELSVKVLPVLILVFALMLLVRFFAQPQALARKLNQRSAHGWLIAIFGGIVSMGAAYLWYPLMQNLRQADVRDAFLATFMYNRAIKLPLLPFLVYYFGWTFTLVLTIYMIIFSIPAGLLVERWSSPGQNINRD